MKSLAEFLDFQVPSESEDALPRLEDINDPHEFARAVLNSIEFRRYIVNMLQLGEIPSPILLRVMDLAGWQKPPERIELTGKDGGPITEVRRVIVRGDSHIEDIEERQAERQTVVTKH